MDAISSAIFPLIFGPTRICLVKGEPCFSWMRSASDWTAHSAGNHGLADPAGGIRTAGNPDGLHFEQSTNYHVYTSIFSPRRTSRASANGVSLPQNFERTRTYVGRPYFPACCHSQLQGEIATG